MDILLDANVIIDLIELGCFDNVLDSAALRLWVVENVKAEITYPTQREPLEQRIRQGRIRETQVERLEELQTYTELQRVLADGEAASLAVAGHRGWAFATYEKGRTEREALRLLGPDRYLRTPELLIVAIREGVVTTDMLMNRLLALLDADLDEKERKRLAHLITLHREVQRSLSGWGGTDLSRNVRSFCVVPSAEGGMNPSAAFLQRSCGSPLRKPRNPACSDG